MKKAVWNGLAQNAGGIIALPAAIRFSGVHSVAGHVKNRSPTSWMDRCKLNDGYFYSQLNLRMSPVSHLLISWIVADRADLTRRDRVLVALAGVAPDIDGAGIIAEILTEKTKTPLLWWSKYHHVLCHNIGFGLALMFAAVFLSLKKWRTAFLSLLVFHMHLFCDFIGSRGPEGYQWPIPYFFPFSERWQLSWEGQWELNAWPNLLLTALVLAATIYFSWKNGYSPLEIFSKRADTAFVSMLRKKFGSP